MRALARASQRSAVTGFSMLATVGRARLGPMRSVHERALTLSTMCRELCELHQLRIIVTGDVPPGPIVVVANHLSYLDPVVIAPAVEYLPISKAEVATWPILGDALRALGVLFVDRDDVYSCAKVLRAALRILEEGTSILNFPEGTTTEGRMLPFRRGIFGAARIARVPVVPVAVGYESTELYWTGNQTFMPHYWRTARRTSTTAYLNFGEPMAPESSLSAEALAWEASERIRNLAQVTASPGATTPSGGDENDTADSIRISTPRTDTVFSASDRPVGRPWQR